MCSRLSSRDLPVILLYVCLGFAVACSTVVGDYDFRAVGTVVAEDGSPLPGVRVTIRIYGPVYRVIDPVSEDHVLTDRIGRFHFDYISHQANPPYTLVFEHPGFETETIEGAVQEMNPHKVVMRHAPSHPQASNWCLTPACSGLAALAADARR